MNLGCFSISLTVKDIKASRLFYEALGFKMVDGNEDQRWLVMQNGECKIGLFEGMFDTNMLTFNPGDVRSVQDTLKAAGFAMEKEAEQGTGPTHAAIKDPDGNMILLDQFEGL